VGEDLEDDRHVARVCAEPCEDGARLVPCFGLHPDRFADDRDPPTRDEIDGVAALVREHAGDLAAIGEVGLDRWWVKDDARRRAQAEVLEELAALSVETGLPLNVHSRSAGHYTIDLLLSAGAERVLMHAFDGKASHAARAAEHGYVLSIPPSIVRSDQKKKLVRKLPLEALALESDSPVLGPERRARNEPANLALARDVIAELHGASADHVEEQTTANARRLFPSLA